MTILNGARCLTALLVIAMAAGKIGDPDWLLRMGIPWIPQHLAQITGAFLPWAEISLGILMLGGKHWREATTLTALMLVAFVPILVLFVVEGRADCGCGSKGFLPEWTGSPLFAIARNTILAGILFFAAWHRPPPAGKTQINEKTASF